MDNNSKEAVNDTVFLHDTININKQEAVENTEYCVTIYPINQYGLFVNIENPIDISVFGIASKYIEVKCTNGIVSRSGTGFNIKTKELGATIIEVYNQGKLLRSFHFSAIKLPKPTPLLGNFRGKIIEKKNLLELKGLWAKMPYFLDYYGAEILCFKIVTYYNGIPKEASSESSRFTGQQIELIKELQPGQMLYFEDIKAKTEDGFEHELEILKVIVK
jgi:hypothetical protein